MNDFTLWLQEELLRRGWSQAQLAKRIKRSRQSISAVMTGKNSVTIEFCDLVADVFNESPESLYKLAGIVQYNDDVDPTAQTVLSLLSDMNDKSRSDVLQYTRLRHKNPID